MVLGKIIIGIITAVLLIYFLFAPCDPSKDFVCCLKNNNLTVYFEESCPHSQKELKILANYAKYINFVNCTLNESKCKNIRAVPAYKFGNKTDYGVKNETDLMIMLGCRKNTQSLKE